MWIQSTLFLCLAFLFSMMIGNTPSVAQTGPSVIVEAPKPLGDVRALHREPETELLEIVSERLVPELEVVPMRWHGFSIFPKIETAQYVDTNIYATNNNEEVDTITTIEPSLFIVKDFGRHQVNFSLHGKAEKYWDNESEDTIDFETKFGGYLEANRDIKFPFELFYKSGHKKRTQNFSNNFTLKPTEFDSVASAFGVTYAPNRFSLSLIGRYSQIQFKNGVNRIEQAVIQEDGDYKAKNLEMRAAYKIIPNHEPFLSVTVGKTDYKHKDFQNGSFSGPQRSSKHVNFLTGWALAYKGLLEGYLGVGYGKRKYDDPQLKDIDSLKMSGNLDWNLTKKATLNLGLHRGISEDNDVVQGILLTQGHVQLDYEFLHNLFFKAFANKALADFRGISREDIIDTAGLGVRYVINPLLSLSGEYTFTKRSSDQAGLDYDQNRIMIRLKKHF